MGELPHPTALDALPEGEEQAPPGTRTMAVVRWALVGLMAVAAVSAWSWYVARSGVISAEARFHCPMHPQIVTAQKGECPVCGMDLVPVSGAVASRPAAGDAARAPDAAPPPDASAQAAAFTCPMHPDFVTPDPKARCPECGMKLTPRAPAAPAPQRLAGLAPVELSLERIQLSGMKTALAARERLAVSLRAAGFVSADENGLVSVTTRYSGWIESTANAQTGQAVRRGDVLARVYSPELVNAQQAYANAVRWLDTPPAVAGPNTAPNGDLRPDARARLELLGVAPEDLDAIAATKQPQRAVAVRAPAKGYVVRRNAQKGLYVTPGFELFQLADLSKVWVIADLAESEIDRVRVGQPASLEVAAYPGQRFQGTVQFIYPAVNPGTRTLQARLELPNPAMKLRPGMYGDVTLEAGAAEAVVVPREAVVDTGEVQYVFVARGGGRFEPRRVRLGPSSGDKVAVIDGLAGGERVVTTANFLLDSESRLRAAVEGFGGAGAPAP
jgi:Cu(I)/Ag(I) efflux system membrane fusion protein